MGYLDSAGLAYLWKKIKSLVSGAGDMRAEVYDAAGRARDVFAYADALRPRCVLAVLPAGGWTGSEAPYRQTVSIPGLTENGTAGLAEGASAAEREAARRAQIGVLGRDTAGETITFVADGERPEVDLPIALLIQGGEGRT